jgi:drug/metabolite transporter (DMT)-like permease
MKIAISKTAVLIAVVCLVWGSTWIVIAGGLADLPPLTSAAARFSVAAVAMSVVAHFLKKREGGSAPTLALSIGIGSLNFGACYGLVYWSETRLPSAFVSVLWSVFPMLMAISEHFFLAGDKLRPRQWAGFGVGFLGVALLFATDLAKIGPGAIPAGAILLGSPLLSVVGTTIVKRKGAHTSSVLLNRNGMWIGAAILAAAAWRFERDAPAHWTAPAIASVLYLALAGTVLTFSIYFWLLRHTPASRLSLTAYVTPAIALLLGGVVGREPITGWTLSGSGLILAGVALVVRGGRSKGSEKQGVPSRTTRMN